MTASCGPQSTPIPSATRHTLKSRNGETGWRTPRIDVASAADAGNGGGSCNQYHVNAAVTPHNNASAPNTLANPLCDANVGNTSAPSPPPAGTAVCRMLIARPRSPSANQAITARPLDPLTLPPSKPTASNPPASATMPGT